MEYDAVAAAKIRPTKEQVEDELLALDGVVGVDIGEKISDGEPTGEMSIIVYVEEKRAPSRVAKSQKVPAEVGGVPTDVQELVIELQAGPGLYAGDPLSDTSKHSTIRGGISIGPARHTNAGTGGAMVRDSTTGAVSILTNFHVACVDTSWSAGESVLQPGRYDSGNPATDQVGTLTRGVISEQVDGAVVRLDTDETWEDEVVDIGAVGGSTAATVGMAVQKRGRTTEHTHGEVVSVDATVTLDYGNGVGVRTLRHQVSIRPASGTARFSDRGDSGSVVMNGSRQVVGLLFAGARDGSLTFANPIASVLSEMQVSLNPPRLAIPPLTSRIAVLCRTRTDPWCVIRTRPLVDCPPVDRTRPFIDCPPVLRTRIPVCQPIDSRICPPVDSRVCGGWQRPFDQGWGESPGYQPDDGAFWAGYHAALDQVAQELDEAEQGGQPG
ncbi:hypothetical protein [Serinicoccus kebangsaanensis]|uniref:hypothetical protein n=1 Tax=Serinicoccus kebangsaanensis TaxID=2602069 RepID=UPI00124C0709|nr:hypothetical protein [Serinicoccus kebangsaanensis]